MDVDFKLIYTVSGSGRTRLATLLRTAKSMLEQARELGAATLATQRLMNS
jgi:hypothetical protein